MKQLSALLLASVIFFGVTSCREVYDPTDEQVIEVSQEGIEAEQQASVHAFTVTMDEQITIAPDMEDRIPMRQLETITGGSFFSDDEE